MRGIHHKSNQGAAFLGWSKNTCPWQFVQAIECITRQLRVVFENCCASDSIEVIDRRGQTDCTGDVWRASFKPMWRFLKHALFQSDAHDHFAAAVQGGMESKISF